MISHGVVGTNVGTTAFFLRYRDVVGPSMINKSMDHVEFIVRRLHQKLVDEDVCKRLRQQ